MTIARAAISLSYPAHFMLIAAMNPCPCGYLGDRQHECTCSPSAVQRYRARLSGPLLDRVDLHIEVPAVKYRELADNRPGEISALIRERVNATRQRQLVRFRAYPDMFCNAQMATRHIRQYCPVDEQGEKLLERAITRLGLSAKAYDRILKVSRTIADLEDCDAIEPTHVAEAIQYRTLDRSI